MGPSRSSRLDLPFRIFILGNICAGTEQQNRFLSAWQLELKILDWRQVLFGLCVARAVVLHLNGDTALFYTAAAAAMVHLFSWPVLCVFGQTCTLGSDAPYRVPAFFLVVQTKFAASWEPGY